MIQYVVELFNNYCSPDIYEFDTEKEARKFLKSELHKNPKRGWELKKVKMLDGSNYK